MKRVTIEGLLNVTKRDFYHNEMVVTEYHGTEVLATECYGTQKYTSIWIQTILKQLWEDRSIGDL